MVVEPLKNPDSEPLHVVLPHMTASTYPGWVAKAYAYRCWAAADPGQECRTPPRSREQNAHRRVVQGLPARGGQACGRGGQQRAGPAAPAASIPRNQLLAMMRRADYPPERIEQAAAVLPEHVDRRDDHVVLAKLCLSLGELTERMGSNT